jgi:hypothetical protein
MGREPVCKIKKRWNENCTPSTFKQINNDIWDNVLIINYKQFVENLWIIKYLPISGFFLSHSSQ